MQQDNKSGKSGRQKSGKTNFCWFAEENLAALVCQQDPARRPRLRNARGAAVLPLFRTARSPMMAPTRS
jgi:hypothetical protein